MVSKNDIDKNISINQLDKNEIAKELMSKQLKKISQTKKLQFSDIKRICKHITTSIFDESICSIWDGYVTNMNNKNKGTYINFYFRGKKVALHRLLYTNFIEELNADEYLKYTCENCGKCCNIQHLKKFKYQRNNGNENNIKVSENTRLKKKYIKIITIETVSDNDLKKLTLTFD